MLIEIGVVRRTNIFYVSKTQNLQTPAPVEVFMIENSGWKRTDGIPSVSASESQFRQLLEMLPVGAYTCDRDGLITFYNEQAVKLWGRAPRLNDPVDRFCGSYKLFDAEQLPIRHDDCWMALALRDEQEYNGCEIVIERPDGSRVTSLAHASPIRDESDKIVGAVNLLVDITDRNRADDARALLAAIVKSSDDAIISKTLDGTITSWNASAERLFGYSTAEAVGRSIMLVTPPERYDEERMILARLRRGERIEHYETVRLTKDGRRLDVSLTASPIHGSGGQVSSVIRDITDRNRAVEALRDSEERFHTLADNIAQFAWMADDTGSIVWYNKRWFDYTGTTFEEMRGWGWQQVHHPDHVVRVVEKIRGCFSTGEVWEDTFPLRGKDGQYRWFLSRAIPICDASGKVVRWFGTNTDVTVERDTEEALRQADRRKDEFLAVLAHELRNPLAPISNSLHILRLAEDLDPGIDKVREIMERQTNLLVRLVDDLLEVSRITQGKIDLRSERIDLAAVIRSAVETSRPQIDARRHQLAITVSPGPITVEADPIRLAQVICNLLNNAAKFTPEGGQIWLSARAKGGQAVISVRDNGVGIPLEVLPLVFEMFTQVAAPEARPLGGLGIGLTLAKTLVQLHGGQIEARSDGPGKGSQFTVRLPLAASAAAEVARSVPPKAIETSPAPRRILVVDDTRDSALILGKLLEALGHHVVVAGCGSVALELARTHRPDVVISDIAMADMDGCELARRLRYEPGLEGMMLVALTGYGQERDRRRTEEAGFDHHLVKPVSLEVLERMFTRVPKANRPLAV